MVEQTLTYFPAGMCWKTRDAAIRAALAGVPVTTPTELIIFMGGRLEDITPRQIEMAAWDLRTLGYKRDVVSQCAYGASVERYIRRIHWPEDDQWPA